MIVDCRLGLVAPLGCMLVCRGLMIAQGLAYEPQLKELCMFVHFNMSHVRCQLPSAHCMLCQSTS